MSEEGLKDEGLALEDGADLSEPEDKQIEEVPQEPTYTHDQERAMRDGWTGKKAWVDSGKDEDEWVSAKKFNERGQMMGDIRSLKKENDAIQANIDKRLEDQRKYLDIQHKMSISTLEGQRKTAIEEADVDRAESIQGQIDSLKENAPVDIQPAAPQNKQPDADLLDRFNTSNPWVKDRTPKAMWMIDEFTRNFNSGMGTQEAIEAAEKSVSASFPSVNPRRQEAAAVEGGKSGGGKKSARALAWGDLTRDEVSMYSQMGGSGSFTKEAFLQVVKDARTN